MRLRRFSFLLASGALAALTMLGLACSGSGGSAEPPKEPTLPAEPAPPPVAPSAAPAAPAAPSAEPTAAAEPPKEPAPEAKPACPKGMALVPGGTFTMSPPKREVTVDAFCMDVSEATADEYTACVKSKQCNADFIKCAPQATYETEGKGDHPINCVDFPQAEAYCKAQNKRLATDAEWEWAARGGAEGRKYPWGDDKPSEHACWSGASLHTGTCAVGSAPKGDNPFGIHDLAGNVFEWTSSNADAKGESRVGRGGSWKDGDPSMLRAARVGSFKTTYRCGFLGIRCVTAAPPGAEAAKSQ